MGNSLSSPFLLSLLFPLSHDNQQTQNDDGQESQNGNDQETQNDNDEQTQNNDQETQNDNDEQTQNNDQETQNGEDQETQNADNQETQNGDEQEIQNADDQQTQNDNPQETQTIPASIPLTLASRRIISVRHNTDIVRELVSYARSIREMIFVVSGHGEVHNVVLSHQSSQSPQWNLMPIHRHIVSIRGVFQPRDIVVPNHVVDTIHGRLSVASYTRVLVSFSILQGEYRAHRLVTSGVVKLEALFFTGVGPMFQDVLVDAAVEEPVGDDAPVDVDEPEI